MKRTPAEYFSALAEAVVRKAEAVDCPQNVRVLGLREILEAVEVAHQAAKETDADPMIDHYLGASLIARAAAKRSDADNA